MNWYSVFYWITVADGVKNFFDIFSNWMMAFAIISGIIMGIVMAVRAGDSNMQDEDEQANLAFWIKTFRRIFIWSFTLCMLFWAGYVFTPSKRDALTIVAGGAIGNFVGNDSAARQIPSELTLLVKEKIQELRKVDVTDAKEELNKLTKEQLVKRLEAKEQ